MDELLGIHEVAERLGVSRQRVYQLIASHNDFPAPIAELRVGRIWRARDVDRWAKAWTDREPRRSRAQ